MILFHQLLKMGSSVIIDFPVESSVAKEEEEEEEGAEVDGVLEDLAGDPEYSEVPKTKRERRHMQKWNRKRVNASKRGFELGFCCNHVGCTFKTCYPKCLEKHQLRHSENFFHCFVCNVYFRLEPDYKEHKSKVHNDQSPVA